MCNVLVKGNGLRKHIPEIMHPPGMPIQNVTIKLGLFQQTTGSPPLPLASKPKQVITIYCMGYFPICLPSHPLTLLISSTLLCGIAIIIGHTEYQSMLRENNRVFSTLTTIPISGIDNSTLGLKIAVPQKDPQ